MKMFGVEVFNPDRPMTNYEKTLLYLYQFGRARPKDMIHDIYGINVYLKRGRGRGTIVNPKISSDDKSKVAVYELTNYGRRLVEQKIKEGFIDPEIIWENPPQGR